MKHFGPAGLGPVKDAISNLEKYHELGLEACEIAFTYGIYIKKEEDAVRIGKRAKELGIKLSIHAPYWINLNSAEEKKIDESKKRILDCCKIGELMGAHRVIFHPGYYGKIDREISYQNIKNRILEMQEEIQRENYEIKLAPETSGKVNVFGSVEEIRKLVEETGCSFCIDFAHVLARYKDYLFEETFSKFENHGVHSVPSRSKPKLQTKEFHIHFSGIEYNDKGEKHHKITPVEEWKKLISALPKNKEIIIINESPTPVEDAILGKEILENI